MSDGGQLSRQQALASCQNSYLMLLVARCLDRMLLQVSHSDEEWHQLLEPAAYRILRQAGTELPFSSPLEKVRVLLLANLQLGMGSVQHITVQHPSAKRQVL